jgi:uncharacterized protein YdcH (DUF465 family)
LRTGASRKVEAAAMHIPHELPEEFPDETALIERLARDNYVFKRLAVRYVDINRQIHRIESEDQPAEDAVLERLKKDRLKLKDEIAHMLTRENRRM